MPETNELSIQKSQVKQSLQHQSDPFEVQSIGQAIELCQRLSKSGMVPRQYVDKPDAILAAWIHGKELGVTLFQALGGISNINGTPAVFGDLGWAIVQNHPDFVDSIETVTDQYAECTVKRRGRSDKTWKYTIEMAKQAGLLGKDNWKNNPRRMLQWRARSWAMRDQFPDALKGLVIYEEAQDYPVIEGGPLVESTPAQLDPLDQFITPEEAKEIWDLAKTNGHVVKTDDGKFNVELYKKALQDVGHCERSDKLTKRHYEAMKEFVSKPVQSEQQQEKPVENHDAEPCDDGGQQ
jgi:hypothetical protein